jgi:hypothetical protein
MVAVAVGGVVGDGLVAVEDGVGAVAVDVKVGTLVGVMVEVEMFVTVGVIVAVRVMVGKMMDTGVNVAVAVARGVRVATLGTQTLFPTARKY